MLTYFRCFPLLPQLLTRIKIRLKLPYSLYRQIMVVGVDLDIKNKIIKLIDRICALIDHKSALQ